MIKAPIVYGYGESGLYSTVEDLYLWDRALYTEKLVSKDALKEALYSRVKSRLLQPKALLRRSFKTIRSDTDGLLIIKISIKYGMMEKSTVLSAQLTDTWMRKKC